MKIAVVARDTWTGYGRLLCGDRQSGRLRGQQRGQDRGLRKGVLHIYELGWRSCSITI